MKTKLTTVPAAACLLFTACQAPQASFTTDREVYKKGESIQVTNTSENAFSYHWKLSNSRTEYNSKEPEIIAPEPGECIITLTAYSRNGGRSNNTSRTVNILPGEGELSFYASTTDALTFTVVLNGDTLGTPAQTYAPVPECKAAGTVTASLAEGTYTFSVIQPSTTIVDDLIVVPNVCKSIKL
jgi:hypothetical protein